ncbi:MAG: hypothetical protein MJ192_00365 [Clostridia bacterium]|nr:hypothetical protein [Clostridia bacterium]
MKHTIHFRLLACLLLAVMALGCLVSCIDSLPEDKRAIRLYEKAEAQADKASSYTIKAKITMSCTVNDQLIKVNADINNRTVNAPEQRTLTENKMSFYIPGTTRTDEYRTEGYMNGKAFCKGETAGIWSEMTPEEYAEWQTSKADEDFAGSTPLILAPEQAAEKTCTKDKTTGEYTVTLKGIAKDNMKELAAGMDTLTEVIGDVTLDGIDVTFVIDKHMYYKEITITFNYSGADAAPEAEIVMTMSDWNSTEIEDIENFDKDYQKVDDIRLPDLVKKAYDDAVEQPHFTLKSTTQTSFNNQSTSTVETDTVDISTEGGYSFTVAANQNRGSIVQTITYKDGIFTVFDDVKGAEIAQQEMTEGEAKSFIRTIANPVSFSDTFVSTVKKSKDGQKVEMKLTSEALGDFKRQLTNSGINVTDSSGKVTAELDEEGSVVKIVLRMEYGIKVQNVKGTTVVEYTLDLSPKS